VSARTRFSWQDVLDATGALPVRGARDAGIAGVSTDTRTLRAGELFIALQGPNFDGNRFALEALARGASACLLSWSARELAGELPSGVAVAVHPDPRRALAELGAWYRTTLDAVVLAITGSCGKTTTKNIVRELFSRRFPVVASPSSFNNDIGVPHTLLCAERSTRLLAVEMGTNHPGEIAALCRITRPFGGIITNVGAAHLEGLGSLEGVAREKGELAAALPREGFCVLDAHGRHFRELAARTAARVITFSVAGGPEERGDLDATELHFHSGGTTFRLEGREVTSPLLGTHNVQNLLAALCVARGLGVPLEELLPAVATLRGGKQRMERLELDGLTVLDDSYNANPESLRAAVRVLAGLHGHARRVLILGDMLELGEHTDALHAEVGREAGRAGIDALVLIGEHARAAASGAHEAGLPAGALAHFPCTSTAAAALGELVREGDVVLVKGSRAMGLERLVQALKESRGACVSAG
jgi:UDP-N-acetylmuramoyl-tripeptide--D-alanyl-D-alanine ligase